MNSFQKIFKNELNEYVAIIMMVVFIVTNVKVPKPIGNIIDTLIGRVVIVILAMSLLFVHSGLGVIALVFAYELIRRSETSTGTYQMRHYLPSVERKDRHFTAMNQFPVTLEEQMINNMVPVVKTAPSSSKFKPVMNDLHQAAKL